MDKVDVSDVESKVICGDSLTILKTLPDASVNCCITSPPYYGLRDYGHAGQLGLEKTPQEYVDKMVAVFREVRRVLKDDGTLWLNLGDSYAGGGSGCKTPKQKDLVGIPWMVAFALRADGWYLRQDIIWHKPNPMPESVTDRCTKAHEYIFLMAKSKKYYFDQDAVLEPANYDGRKDMMMKGSKKYADGFVPNRQAQTFHQRGHARWRWKEPMADCSIERINACVKNKEKYDPNYHKTDKTGMAQSPYEILTRASKNLVGQAYRNRRSVWTIVTKPFKGAHFATFPPDLIRPMVLAGCPVGGTVLDPFSGAGTTGLVAKQTGRNFIGCELNPEYVKMAERRIMEGVK